MFEKRIDSRFKIQDSVWQYFRFGKNIHMVII